MQLSCVEATRLTTTGITNSGSGYNQLDTHDRTAPRVTTRRSSP
jgi:hypothetical protein